MPGTGQYPPYPSGNSAPYPTQAPTYPPSNQAPYPPSGPSPYPPSQAPYPTSGTSPYPPASQAPYPPSSSPYPPTSQAPYPPSGGGTVYPSLGHSNTSGMGYPTQAPPPITPAYASGVGAGPPSMSSGGHSLSSMAHTVQVTKVRKHDLIISMHGLYGIALFNSCLTVARSNHVEVWISQK